MGIVPKFNMAKIIARTDRFMEVIKEKQIEMLQFVGEESVRVARELNPNVGFHDRTGVLRSSIGYAIFEDGVMLTNNYEPIQSNSPKFDSAKSAQGQLLGLQLAEAVRSEKSICLVVTAGANYAAALEAGGAWKVASKRGYDVLISARNFAEMELPKRIEGLTNNIKEALG